MSTAPAHPTPSIARSVTVGAALLVLLAELLLPAGHPLATGALIAFIGALMFYLCGSSLIATGNTRLPISAVLGLLLAALMHLADWDAWIAAFMPALFQTWLAVLVARTLRPGKTPVIHRIGAAMQPDGQPLPPEVAVYARHSSWMWLGIFCVLAAINFAVLLLTWPEPKAPLALGLMDLLVAGVVIVLEYFYRRWRFAEHNKHTLVEFCRGLRRVNPLDILLS